MNNFYCCAFKYTTLNSAMSHLSSIFSSVVLNPNIAVLFSRSLICVFLKLNLKFEHMEFVMTVLMPLSIKTIMCVSFELIMTD